MRNFTSLPRKIVDEMASEEFVPESAKIIVRAIKKNIEQPSSLKFDRFVQVMFVGLDALTKLGHTFSMDELSKIKNL